MKKIFTSFIIIAIFCIHAQAQYSRHIVQLTDKKGTAFSLNNPVAYLSPHAIQRRTRQNILSDSTDLPITTAYIDSIRAVPNVTIINYSKWLNQVLIKTTDPNALIKINSFSFVKKTDPIAPNKFRSVDTIINKFTEVVLPVNNNNPVISSINQINGNTQLNINNYFDYGNTYNQIHIHEGEWLHNLGFHGEGITIAILDAGFSSYLTNPAFDSVRLNNQVLGTYDYVNQKQSVNEEHPHGAYCFSIIAANEPGQLVGSAPKAKFWLFKTEDVNSEYPVEEQNWTVAAEYADSAGADLISTSLGYAYFDDSVFDHTYPDRNGHTAMISKAANLAVAKGMIVTASAGNSGNATDEKKYIVCPADADSVLTVGAIDINGIIASFSCWGPNYSGAVKPNVVSVGKGTVFANFDGTPFAGDGTSFSNPNMAGLIACLWQAFPEFTNHDIIDAVQKSSDRYSNPDDRYGYGIPDFQKAYGLLNNKKNLQHYINALGNQWITAYPVPFTNNFTILFRPSVNGTAYLQLIDAIGRKIERKSVLITANEFNTVNFVHSVLLPKGIYFIRYVDSNRKETLRVVKQ